MLRPYTKRMDIKPYLIAIVGRPNVGKSTLFNRLTGKWQAIVEDRPGITRDRLYGDFRLYNHKFRIMDTGGLNLAPKTRIERKMSAQAELGIEEADLILFIMDGRAGATTLDEEWVAKLRKIRTPKIYIVNKMDEQALENKAQGFFELGIHPLIMISAERQRNFSGLSEAILAALKLDKDDLNEEPEIVPYSDENPSLSSRALSLRSGQAPRGDPDAATGLPCIELDMPKGMFGSVRPSFAPRNDTNDDSEDTILEVPSRPIKPQRPPSVAIIGRPNVGKSTLLNAILDQERSIVDDAPGTTRDPIHTYLNHNGQDYCFIDTAGIRKRAKTTERVEKFSVVNALSEIEKSDIVLLIIDGEIGPTDQDAHVAGFAFEKQKALIVVINKWDMGTKKFTREAFKEKLELKMNYLNACPLIFISAKTRKNLEKVFMAIETVRSQYDREVRTGELNKTFAFIVDHHPLPTFSGRDIKMFYATQVAVRPPSFMIFCTAPEHVHFTYRRYLINSFKEAFDLKDVPIRLLFRKR